MVHFTAILDLFKTLISAESLFKTHRHIYFAIPSQLPIGHSTCKLTKIHLTKMAQFTSH